MDDLDSAGNADFAEQSTLLAQEDGLNSSTETVEFNDRFGQNTSFQPREPLIKSETHRPSPFRSSTTNQSTELSMASTASATSATVSLMVPDATRTDSDVSFHTPTSVSNTVLGNDVTQLNSAVAQPVRNISIPLIRGDYTPMQAKVQPCRPTHLYKATYGILEPMVFVVFMNTAQTFTIGRDKHGILLECSTENV